MTRKSDIRRWLERGKEQGASHLIVVCDTFDWEDYPVFVRPSENVKEIEKKYNKRNMQKIMEIYKIDMDFDEQLKIDYRNQANGEASVGKTTSFGINPLAGWRKTGAGRKQRWRAAPALTTERMEVRCG